MKQILIQFLIDNKSELFILISALITRFIEKRKDKKEIGKKLSDIIEKDDRVSLWKFINKLTGKTK